MPYGKYEIRLEYYDANWKAQTVTKYTGSLEEQMLDLLRGVIPIHKDRGIRIYLYDTFAEKESNVHVY